MDVLEAADAASWCLVLGQKDTGKSHLVRHLAHQWHTAGIPCLGQAPQHFHKVVQFAHGPDSHYDFVPPAFRYAARNCDTVLAALLAEQAAGRGGQRVLVLLTECASARGFFAKPRLVQLARQSRHLGIHVLVEDRHLPADLHVSLLTASGHTFCFPLDEKTAKCASTLLDTQQLEAASRYTCTVHKTTVAAKTYLAPATPPAPFRMGSQEHWQVEVGDNRADNDDESSSGSDDKSSSGSDDESSSGSDDSTGTEDGDDDQGQDESRPAPVSSVHPRVFPRLQAHQVPTGSVLLVLGGEGKTHLVKDLAYQWYRGAVAFERVYCFGPRVAQQYGFVAPEFTFPTFCEQAVLDLVKSQGRDPVHHVLVIVDGCAPSVLRTPAMCHLFEHARAAKLRVVVTGPHCVAVPPHVRAQVSLCLLLHTDSWAHRKLCFVQWGGRAFESLRAFDRAFDSLTDDFACMVLGPRVAWYRASPTGPPAFRMGRSNHWRKTSTPESQMRTTDSRVAVTVQELAQGPVLVQSQAQRQVQGPAPHQVCEVSACAMDTRAAVVVGPAGTTAIVARSLADQWRARGTRSLGHKAVWFEGACCFTTRPHVFDFVPPQAQCGAFDLLALRALMDRQRVKWVAHDMRRDLRRPFLCILDRCTAAQVAHAGFQDMVSNAALFGLHILLLLDSNVVVPRALFCAFDTCLCTRDIPDRALAFHQWLPHFDTLAQCEAALDRLPSPHACLVAEYAGPCFRAGVYYTHVSDAPFLMPAEHALVPARLHAEDVAAVVAGQDDEGQGQHQTQEAAEEGQRQVGPQGQNDEGPEGQGQLGQREEGPEGQREEGPEGLREGGPADEAQGRCKTQPRKSGLFRGAINACVLM
jgi:hypothetical protein